MRKIMLAFDGTNFSMGAFEFARRLNEKNRILLAGVFLPQINYANLWSYAEGVAGPGYIPMIEEEETEEIHKNMARFEELCTRNNIEYRIHKDYFDFALPEMKKETLFSDLVILGSESFYTNLAIKEPNEYLKMAMHGAECPVIIVPEEFDYPESNVLAYDGSESSVFAIKQFAYLLPELAANPTLLVYAKDERDEKIPDISNVQELAGRHYPDLTITKLHMDPKDYFATWLADRKHPILVTGSFGRSSFSQVFRKSFIREVIKDHKLPVFIAHK